jgi:hypothetical protein
VTLIKTVVPNSSIFIKIYMDNLDPCKGNYIYKIDNKTINVILGRETRARKHAYCPDINTVRSKLKLCFS